MTQKTPAPDTSSQTKQATAKPAADKDKAKPASRLRSWLIGPAMAAIIGGAAYYVLLEPAPTPPAAVATSHYKANATKADTLDTPQGNFTEVELEELMEAQQQAKRARLALREDIKSNRQRLDELSQQMEELKQAFEQMHANGSLLKWKRSNCSIFLIYWSSAHCALQRCRKSLAHLSKKLRFNLRWFLVASGQMFDERL